VRYGGNTSSVGVTLNDGTTIALDAGSGIRELGVDLMAGGGPPGPVHVMLTHLHMDHLQGLAFFAPMYTPGLELHVWGPPSTTQSLDDRIATYFSPPLFPVRLSDVPCTLVCHDIGLEPFAIGSATVQGSLVSHQGPTLGYRIEENGASFAYIPDHEPSIGGNLDSLEVEWLSGFDLVDHVDVLFHDSQYFDDEYDARVGWGHSAISHVMTLGRKVDARQVVLFHHDPAHTDEDLERLLAQAVDLWGDRPNPPVLAYEGMELVLGVVDGAGVGGGDRKAEAVDRGVVAHGTQ
jgi:phosphoribosyl 1,2-cyclic phosphodiesterase